MENINFSLNEVEINKYENQLCDYLDHSNYLFLDIEQLKNYYNSSYNIKGLTQILQYYGLQKNKMVKEEMIQVL